MIEGTISIRYARALIGIARDNNKIDEYDAQLNSFLEACAAENALYDVLSNSNFSAEKRCKIVADIAEKLKLEVTVQNFLKVLIKKRRFGLIKMIARVYHEMADEFQGRMPMKITSAVELPQEQYQKLQDVFGAKMGKKMVLNKKVDPKVLGGVSVQVGDQIYDMTLSRQLNELAAKMAG